MGSRKYQITLWVNLDEELAIMHLFHDKGWPYIKFQNDEDVGLFTAPESTVEIAAAETSTGLQDSHTSQIITAETNSIDIDQNDHSAYHANPVRLETNTNGSSTQYSTNQQESGDSKSSVPLSVEDGVKVTYLVEDGNTYCVSSLQENQYDEENGVNVNAEVVIPSESSTELGDDTCRPVYVAVMNNQYGEEKKELVKEDTANFLNDGPVYVAVKKLGAVPNTLTDDSRMKEVPLKANSLSQTDNDITLDNDIVYKLPLDLKYYQNNESKTIVVKGKSLLTDELTQTCANVTVQGLEIEHDIVPITVASKKETEQTAKKRSMKNRLQLKARHCEIPVGVPTPESEKIYKKSLEITCEVDGVIKHICCMCNKEFDDSISFEAHADNCLKNLFQRVGSRLYKCKNCPAGFRQISSLLRHKLSRVCQPGMMQKTGEFLTCQHCGKSFRSSRLTEYTIHLLKHRKERAHVCQLCGKSFLRANTLRDHMRYHSGERPFVCRYCPVGFASAAGRVNHEKTNHLPVPKRCVCDKCGASFKFSKGLYSHIKEVHNAEYTYKCEHCNTFFKQKGTLNRHMKRHTNNKDKVCSYCDKAFFLQTDLNLHVKRHRNERSLFCKECGKGFYTKQTLDNHVRTHTGEKPYECSVCSYKCINGGNLKKHIRNRHSKQGLSNSINL